MTASFKVRPARRGDADPIKGLLAETGHAADASVVTWIISHPEMELWVAVDPLDKAIGVVALSHRPMIRLAGRVATIDELVVTKAFRRQGVGRELVKRALERAKVLGVKRIEIQSLGGVDDPAVAFFRAQGFVDAGVLVFRQG